MDCAGRYWAEMKRSFHAHGYVYFTSCSLQRRAMLLPTLANWTRHISNNTIGWNSGYGGRVQDAWRSSGTRGGALVGDAAADSDTLAFLSFLHDGKGVVPFQTLNFRRGTKQPTHSDVVHFDTFPERGQMVASWLALETIHPDSGPLQVYPGSHLGGLWDYLQLGVSQFTNEMYYAKAGRTSYELKLEAAIRANGLNATLASGMTRGTSLVWAASLLHGGGAVHDERRTRLSQVTHYWLRQPAKAQSYFVPRLAVACTAPIATKFRPREANKISATNGNSLPPKTGRCCVRKDPSEWEGLTTWHARSRGHLAGRKG